MDILADQAGDVRGGVLAFDPGVLGEEGVQAGDQLLAAAIEFDQAVEVLRRQPGVLPGVALDVILLAVVGNEGVEGGAPASVGETAAGQLGFGIHVMAVRVAALREEGGVFRLAQTGGGMGHGGVGDGIFHVIADALVIEVGRDESVLLAQVLSPLVEHHGVLHRFIRMFLVKAVIALDEGVGHGDDARVAHHAVGLAAPQVPDRNLALLVVDADHRADHVVRLVRMDDIEQRHGGPVGIPEGEDGVVGEITLVDLAVRSAVFPVDVIEDGGMDHGVVQGGIEDRPGGRVLAGDVDLGEFLVPGGIRGGAGRVEIPAREFSGHGRPGTFDADRAEGHLDKDLRDLSEVQPGIEVVLETGRKRLGEFRIEIDMLVIGPAGGAAPALDGTVADHFETGVGGTVPAAAILQVDHDGGFLFLRIGVAVHAHAGGGGD